MSTPLGPEDLPTSPRSQRPDSRSVNQSPSGERSDRTAPIVQAQPVDENWSKPPATEHTGTDYELRGTPKVVSTHTVAAPQPEPVVRHDTTPHIPVVEPAPAPPVMAHRPERPALPDRETVLARERDRFGGMKFGSAFFGWLAATGMAVLLIAILAATGVAFGVTKTTNVNSAVQATQSGTGTAKTVGLVGAIVLLVILLLAYFCGGYVAGRMARFDGFKQGFGVWLWAILTSAIIAAVAAIAGAKYNVLSQLNLPRIPVKEGTVTTVGLIAIGAAILAALIGALIGGKVGTRYHRKVDAAGFETYDRV